MFGYTLPLYSRMSPPDLADYRRYYCETCHQLRDGFGLFSTLTVSYDMTFNSLIANSVSGSPNGFGATANGPLCVFRGPYSDSEVLKKMAGYSILLVKWELVDDDTDKPSKKNKFASLALNRAIEKAERMYPEYDEIVGEGYGRLVEMESEGRTDPVGIGAEFGKYLAEPLMDIIGTEDGSLRDLFTELTAAVYVIDAVDDLDEDYINGTYNPFLAGYSEYSGSSEPYRNRDAFVNGNLYEITNLVREVMADLQKSYSLVRKKMEYAVGVTDNIVMHGIPESAKNVIAGTGPAKPGIRNSLEARRARNRTG
ncbi:MAG: DUF5685 family protein [Candidatus Methanomethylophilaceae archaeon]|jgi:hypothetical protein